jgi:hypothetical protein
MASSSWRWIVFRSRRDNVGVGDLPERGLDELVATLLAAEAVVLDGEDLRAHQGIQRDVEVGDVGAQLGEQRRVDGPSGDAGAVHHPALVGRKAVEAGRDQRLQ